MHTIRLFCAFTLGIAAGFFASTANADDAVEAAKQTTKSEARAMLSTNGHLGEVDRKPTAEDFRWAALTNHGAADKANPMIGAASGKAYYDFKDGLPHPYYIVPATK